MNLIIVSGPEASGKTAIAKHIAKNLGYVYRGKDELKEALFDKAPVNTWHFVYYEKRAKNQLFDLVDNDIKSKTSIIIESNFFKTDKRRLKHRLNDEVKVTEIFCTAKGFTSLRRFVARNESGHRHKGHHDRRWYPNVFFNCLFRIFGIDLLYKPFGFNDRLMFVDSTDFSKIDYDKIIEFIKQK